MNIEEIIKLDNIPTKPEWDKISEAYHEAIVQFKDYQLAIEELVDQLVGRKKILDLGCGEGYPLREILERDSSRSVVGVDSNPSMLKMALSRFKEISKESNIDYRLYLTDATKFNLENNFDAVISFNVLFNLKDPMKLLDIAYNCLSPDGLLVISSPFKVPDFVQHRKKMEEQFKEERVLESKREFINTVFEVNEKFPLTNNFNLYSIERMKKILIDYVGFAEIEHISEVYGQNFLISARKPKKENSLYFIITDEKEKMDKGFRLRYHWLCERFKYIEPNKEEIYKDPEDKDTTGIFAFERNSDKLIGFMNYVPPRNNLPFANKQLLQEIKDKYRKVACFDSMNVVSSRQKHGVGAYIMALGMNHALQQGVSAVVAEAQGNGIKVTKNLGWEIAGDPCQCTGKKIAEIYPMVVDLRSPLVVKKIEETIDHYEKLL